MLKQLDIVPIIPYEIYEKEIKKEIYIRLYDYVFCSSC